MSMQTTRSVWQRRCAHFFGEKLLHRLFGAVFADPQQDPPFQIVDYCQIHLPLAATHFIDANDMHRRALPVAQTVFHGPLHDRGHALPVQSVLARRSLPTQFAGQHGHRIGQRRGHARPRFGPGEILHPHPAPGTFHSPRAVAQFQGKFRIDRSRHSRGLRTLCTFRHRCRQTPQRSKTAPQPVDVDDHVLLGLLHLRHGMGFQSQLLSDKCFDEHLDSSSSRAYLTALKELSSAPTVQGQISGVIVRQNPQRHGACSPHTLT